MKTKLKKVNKKVREVDVDMMNIALLLKPKMSVAHLTCEHTIRQGLEKMRYHGYTEIPVTDAEGIYLGTISEGDFLWYIYDRGALDKTALETLLVEDVINTERSPSVRIDATMRELLYHVVDQNFVPVVDDRGGFMGIVTRKDVIKIFADPDKFEED